MNYPHEPGAKTEGTSREAAESMKPTFATLRSAVLKLLLQPAHISTGLTADEAAMHLHESVLSIRPRFSELLNKGEIRDAGCVRQNASGRNATVWVAVLRNEQMVMPV